MPKYTIEQIQEAGHALMDVLEKYIDDGGEASTDVQGKILHAVWRVFKDKMSEADKDSLIEKYPIIKEMNNA